MAQNPSVNVYVSYPGALLEPSFLDAKVTTSTSVLNAGAPSGGTPYDAWCLNVNVQIPVPATYTATLYSAYELSVITASVPTLRTSAYLSNLDNINWLLNYYTGTNPGISFGEVQSAIWQLMGYKYPIAAYLAPQDVADIDALVAQALAHDGYVPDAGESIGIVLDTTNAAGTTHYQPLIIETKAARLGDFVFDDLNANGLQDAGEQGIAGARVELVRDMNGDGQFSASEVLASTVSDAGGGYSFRGLTPGLSYQVRFVQPTGFDAVSPRQVDGNAASGANSDALVSALVVLKPGEVNSGIDAGFYRYASVGDRAWHDANGNGVQDAGEAGIAGVTVNLLDATGVVMRTTQTDANGNYAFTGLRPGVYDVQFATPNGFSVTRQHVGAQASDSDIDAAGLVGRFSLTSGAAVTTVDAGFYKLASLGDRLWLDANGNGAQDAGEQGIAGQIVTLIGGGADGVIGNADDTTATMTTDAEGRYHFGGLTPGVQYQVVFGKPEGRVFTQRDAAGDAVDSDANAQGASQVVTLASGEDNTSIDAGVYVPASMGDRAWEDSNGNGVQDVGEAGLAGITVNLLDASGAVVGTTQTGAGGAYAFTGLHPGVYDVQFATPNGFTVTRQHVGADATDSDADATGFAGRYTLASGDAVTTVDAGFYRQASLGDRLWLDANGNGAQDAGEQGIAGQTVTLIGGGADGVIGNADDTTATMTTGADGHYHFSGLTPGVQYQVVFGKPEGSVFTQRDAAGDLIDSDANAQGASQVVTLASGEDNTSIDAGVYVPASMGDRAWEDSNGNGVQDTGEAGLAGVTVNLLDASGAVVGTTQTDAAGAYVFTGLRPGVYDVQFATPDGFTVTRQHVGANTTDSDADATGFAGRYTLASGDAITTVDAGFYRQASLGDRLWLDANGNGQQDAGEQGIAGQTVTLIGSDNTTATMTTDAEGRYHFSGLTPGVQYQVVFGKPAGSVFTTRDAAGDTVDSDANAQGASQVVTLASGEDNTSIDAGVYVPASMGDRAWEDSNGNGVQDTGEAGIVGVTVTLLDAAGAVVGTTHTDASGAYAFTGLRPGVYDVQFATPDGFTVTRQHIGANATDSDADATGFAGRYTLASGDAVTTVDAGFYKPASLGDRVWLDLNGNGQQDAGEAGVAGVRVTLLDAAGTAVGSPQLTDANGNYLFTGLAPGAYSVSFDPATLPAGYSPDTDGLASPNGGNGLSVPATLGSGQVSLDGDLGLTGRVGLDIEKYVHGEVLQQSAGSGGEGLTPGFWKNHTGDGAAPLSGWPETGLSPNASFEALFGVDVPGGAPTLLQALSASGGGVNALLRHAAAALLNAADPCIDYLYSREQIVAMVRQAFASGDYETPKNQLATQNELGADLSTPATPTAGSTLLVSPDEDADTLDTAPVIAAGGQAVFTYEITNTGTVALSDVRVTDDRIATVSFVGGDDDHDGQLDVGETWIYTAQETVQPGAVVTNVGTATARDAVSGRTASDSDVAIYTSTGLSQSMGDRVWLDANGNGLQDAGEAGMAGVTVQLRSTAGALLQTTTTDANGNYAFNVAAGSYQLAIATPAGYVLSARDQGTNDAADSDFDPATAATATLTVGAGQHNLSVDAGLRVAGTPELDLEKLVHAEYLNQQAGGGEGLTPGFWKNHTGDGGAPLSGWPETGLSPNASFEVLFGVDVPGAAPTLLQALSTNGGGVNALLRHAAAALLNAADPYVDYLYSREQVVSMVRQAFASGDYETAKNLFATQNELGADLATPARSLSTLVVTADVDADTAATALVVPAAGTAVYTYVLTNTGNVALSNVSVGDDRLSGITFVGGDTDRDGQLDVGETWTYTAREAVAAGATLSSTGTASGRDAATGNVVRDSDAAHVSSSAMVQTLGDKVWLDANANGVQDAGEAGLAGVTVRLLNTAGTPLQTAVTDASGNYAFNVAAGSYQLAITAPTGYVLTGRDRGTSDNLDSDFDAASGRTATLTVAAGQRNLTVDAGLYQTASLGDRVWCDANGNGVQDSGEAGVAGVTVKLLDATGATVLATTTTTTGGAYAFNGLAPGDYRVQVVRPSGYQAFTRADQGGSDALDSDVDANGLSAVVHLAAGAADASVDAGFAPNTTTLTYSFDGNTAVDGSDGNTRSWSVGGVSVTASAFSRDAWGAWSKAYLGAYSGGLGVTDASENGSGVTHTIDNVGRQNFVVLQFSQNVVVDKAFLGYVYGDSDLTAWVGSSASTLTGLSDTLLNGMARESNDTTSTATRWADLNAGAREGNVLVIAASVSDTAPNDYFKLSQLVVSTKSTTVTPLALDLDGDGVETVARADSAGAFDLLGNGQAVASGWIAADDALLARDVNGNGRIDDMGELFGGTADGAGFARLAALDGNADGVIDARDAHFGELLAWRDLNGDHQSSANELMTLADAGVASLSVGYTVQPFWDAQGNLHLEHGVATRADGSAMQVTDVHFDTGLGAVACAPVAGEEGGDMLSLLGTTLRADAALHALAV